MARLIHQGCCNICLDCMPLSNRRGVSRHQLFVFPPARTFVLAILLSLCNMTAFNTLLAWAPDCDLIADEWKSILFNCLEFCEMIAPK